MSYKRRTCCFCALEYVFGGLPVGEVLWGEGLSHQVGVLKQRKNSGFVRIYLIPAREHEFNIVVAENPWQHAQHPVRLRGNRPLLCEGLMATQQSNDHLLGRINIAAWRRFEGSFSQRFTVPIADDAIAILRQRLERRKAGRSG